VQWHPEWRCDENPFYAATFHAFGQALRRRQQRRWQAQLAQPTTGAPSATGA